MNLVSDQKPRLRFDVRDDFKVKQVFLCVQRYEFPGRGVRSPNPEKAKQVPIAVPKPAAGPVVRLSMDGCPARQWIGPRGSPTPIGSRRWITTMSPARVSFPTARLCSGRYVSLQTGKRARTGRAIEETRGVDQTFQERRKARNKRTGRTAQTGEKMKTKRRSRSPARRCGCIHHCPSRWPFRLWRRKKPAERSLSAPSSMAQSDVKRDAEAIQAELTGIARA